MNDLKFMRNAILEAKKAEKKDEVPVGCVIVLDGKIIARAHNLRETNQQGTAHAEIIAINKACKKVGSWRLENAELYVTLEPCPMCSGAILQSRIKRVVFGAHEPKFGACGSVFNLFSIPFNHHVEICGGVLEEQCKDLLQSFFKLLRARKGEVHDRS